MFHCIGCGKRFDTPRHFREPVSEYYPYGMSWDGCPLCGDGYKREINCNICGKAIKGDFIHIKDGQNVCTNCYTYDNSEEIEGGEF
jgi:hypothetical protein